MGEKKTALVIMAAGIGSRFGQGIKQLTQFGPGGEIIMDYAIYDALRAGFDRVVFVIRKDLEKDFRAIIGDRIAAHVPVAYAFQEKEDLPGGRTVPEGRKKPWGTGQAILACRDLLDEPFAVVNADDFYGHQSFELVHRALQEGGEGSDDPGNICMAGFVLRNTLSEHGGVTRGICGVDDRGDLIRISETKNIVKTPDGAAVLGPDGEVLSRPDADSLVSMNFWGFQPSFISRVLEPGFAQFLDSLTDENRLTAEYLLPIIVDQKIRERAAKVSVLRTTDKWFGVTYQEDVPAVRAALLKLTEEGVYPKRLWD